MGREGEGGEGGRRKRGRCEQVAERKAEGTRREKQGRTKER